MAKTANGNEGEILVFLLLLWMQVVFAFVVNASPKCSKSLAICFCCCHYKTTRAISDQWPKNKTGIQMLFFLETTKKSKIHIGRFLYCIYYFLLFLVLLKTMARRQFSLFLLLPNSSKTNWNRQQQQQLQKVTQRNNQKITDWSWTNCVSYKKSAGRYTILCCDYYNCVSVVVGGVIDEMLMIIFMLIRRFRKGEGVNE